MSNRYRDEPPMDGGCLVILLVAVVFGLAFLGLLLAANHALAS